MGGVDGGSAGNGCGGSIVRSGTSQKWRRRPDDANVSN
jgi:hypothetical protein